MEVRSELRALMAHPSCFGGRGDAIAPRSSRATSVQVGAFPGTSGVCRRARRRWSGGRAGGGLVGVRRRFRAHRCPTGWAAGVVGTCVL